MIPGFGHDVDIDIDMGVSENSVSPNLMVDHHLPSSNGKFKREKKKHFQTNPYGKPAWIFNRAVFVNRISNNE